MKKRTMGSHQSSNMITDEWLTPPHIIEPLGEFDLDPCTPINMPWKTANNRFTIIDNGLKQDWNGRVWLNPPYGREAIKWLMKLSKHNDGIALTFARTETKWFWETVWDKATAVLFLKGRLYFHRIDGQIANANAGAPSVLVAYGKKNAQILENACYSGKIKGKFFYVFPF